MEVRAGLHFGRTDKKEGFTSAGLQPYNDLNPAAIVRELIQNSLDAVREDDRTKTIIRFEMDEMATANIPSIDKYREVFEKSKEAGHDISDGQASVIVQSIASCLRKDKVDVLSVMDNGIGLDEARMNALLADGSGRKSHASSGSVGNGHMTAIPASDLRYVLYGGVCKDGGKTASGHAILASFYDETNRHSGMDGYYILGFRGMREHSKGLYEYPVQERIVPLIKNRLDWIEGNFESKTGAVVVIPGFNRFHEDKDPWDVIKKAAACNFFAAIAEGSLEVVYQDIEGERRLNEASIRTFFEGSIATEKRAKTFISGSRAAGAYDTAITGERHIVDVDCGEVEVLVREVKEGVSRINLCRNGMWITDNLPHLNVSKFNDRKPFSCLIKVHADSGGIHGLIRKSEGPLHNDIEAQKRLEEEDKNRMKKAFTAISDFLSERLEKLQDKEFFIDDILSISNERFKEWERLRPPSSRIPNERADAGEGDIEEESGGADSESGSNSFKRSGNGVPFGAVPVPTGACSYRIELYPQEELKGNAEAEIRFLLDENIDETCDPVRDGQYVGLKSVRMNEEDVAEENLIRNDGSIVQGVRLGSFKPGEDYMISFDYELPEGIAVQEKDKIVLRAEVVRRRRV